MPPEDSLVAMVMYTHDPEGKDIAQPLMRGLDSAGVTVVSDRDLKLRNVSSLPEWMHRSIVENPVIVVVSKVLVENFARGDGSSEHAGIVYETRVLLEKIYRHTRHDHCPVIPVAAPDFSADRVPHILASLEISRFDPSTGKGVAEIVRRLEQLGPETEVEPCASVDMPDDGPGTRKLEDVLRDLATIEPAAPEAPALVREWLDTSADEDWSLADVPSIFPMFERILKASGDVTLMRDFASRCLKAFDNGDLSDMDKRAKARVLICGQSWMLRRQRELRLALDVTQQGVDLAIASRDLWVVALGRRCLARIHRAMAEDSEGDDRETHLVRAVEQVEAAIELFREAELSHEEAITATVTAHIHFTRYQLYSEGRALRMARRYADDAARRVGLDLTRGYYELLILRARIATAENRKPQAWELLGLAISGLEESRDDGASYMKLLGHAYLARAELLRKQGRGSATAMTRDATAAAVIFESLGLRRSVAECEWFLVTAARRLPQSDIRLVETMCPDLEERMSAVRERWRRIEERENHLWPRKAEWRDIVETVRGRR